MSKQGHRRRMKIVIATLVVWAVLSAAWAALLWPTLLWWKESVTWIVIMSWWANVASSAANLTAAWMMWTNLKEGGSSN